MPTQYIKRTSDILPATAKPHASPIYVDSDSNILKMIPASSGTTEVQIVDASSTQTLTNKTLTSPTITGGTQTTPTFNAATLSSPVITGGTIAGGTQSSPAITGGTQTSPVINAATLSSPVVTGTLTSGLSIGSAIFAYEALTTEGSAARNYGFSSIVSSTSPTAKTYTLAAPIQGAFKVIANINVGSTGTATVTTAGSTRFLNPAGTIATFSTGLGSIAILGITSSSWQIISYTTDITIS